jgi:putative salt-induced outer membrane protein YdiY
MPRRAALLFPLTVIVVPVLAAEPAVPGPKRPWTDVAELGLVITSGNAEVSNLAFSNKYAYAWTRSEFLWNIAGLRNETTDKTLSNTNGTVAVQENTRTTAEAYSTDVKYRHDISDALYWFGNAAWLRNEFAGLDNRYLGGAGLGYRFLQNDRHVLQGEIGGEYVDESFVDGGSDSFAALHGSLGYAYTMSDSAKFTSDLDLWENLDDTSDWRGRLALAVISTMTKKLALKVGYTILYDNVPVTSTIQPDAGAPTGTPAAVYEFETTDTVFNASLVVTF